MFNNKKMKIMKKNSVLVKSMFMNILTAGIFGLVFTACSDDEVMNGIEQAQIAAENLKQAGEFYATMPKEELMQMMAQDPILRRDWDDKYGDRMQKLVFIGQHLDRETIEKNLDACLD
jgi:hypothetical protein